MKRFYNQRSFFQMIMIPHIIALVIIVGVVDAWLDLRSKFSNKIRTE